MLEAPPLLCVARNHIFSFPHEFTRLAMTQSTALASMYLGVLSLSPLSVCYVLSSGHTPTQGVSFDHSVMGRSQLWYKTHPVYSTVLSSLSGLDLLVVTRLLTLGVASCSLPCGA